jgi:uncharacterized protein
MRRLFLITIIALILSGCSNTKQPTIELGGSKLNLEIARTPTEQTKGLSGHPPLRDNQAMLFVFPTKTIQSFWMKDMLFPIDIVWLDDNKIVKISKHLQPEGTKPENIYHSDFKVNNVLEIKAGQADALSLHTGDIVKYDY